MYGNNYYNPGYNPQETKIIQIGRGDEFGMISVNDIDLDGLINYIEQKFHLKKGTYNISVSSSISTNNTGLYNFNYSKPKTMKIESDAELICAITACSSIILNLNIIRNDDKSYSMHVKSKL